MKVLVMSFICLLSIAAKAQRVYGEEGMRFYNKLIDAQVHLDSVRRAYGPDLQMVAYITGAYSSHDSIVLRYNHLGNIIEAGCYINGNELLLDGTYQLHYNAMGKLILIDSRESPTYNNHRFELEYDTGGRLLYVASFDYNESGLDTIARYKYGYQKGMLAEKVYQGWVGGAWQDRNRYTYGWDSLGRIISKNYQSTATNGKFENIGYYPVLYHYDTLERIDFKIFHTVWHPGKQYKMQYLYHENKLAYIASVEDLADTTIYSLSSMFWYAANEGPLLEEVQGSNKDGIWMPHTRLIYQYYPNGLLKGYQELRKRPEESTWTQEERYRRYYYNRTE